MITIILIALTVVVSALAFRDRKLFYSLSLNPYDIHKRNQYYRMITHAFVHANWTHLLVNMFVFWSFGTAVERYFDYFAAAGWIKLPGLSFLLLYFLGVVFASTPDVFQKKTNAMYNSVGASGGVAAVLFASIFINPWSSIYLFAVLPIPSVVFGVLYIAYSQYMNNRDTGPTNHKAHIWGAVFGMVFMALLNYRFALNFFQQLFFLD